MSRIRISKIGGYMIIGLTILCLMGATKHLGMSTRYGVVVIGLMGATAFLVSISPVKRFQRWTIKKLPSNPTDAEAKRLFQAYKRESENVLYCVQDRNEQTRAEIGPTETDDEMYLELIRWFSDGGA